MNRVLLFTLLFSCSLAVSAADKATPCKPLSFVDSVIKELMADVEDLTRHKAKKLATELILRQCKHEKENGVEGVRIRDNKVKFSEFSDTYNVKDPIYFCKNKKGYHAYLSQMTGRLLQVQEKNNPKVRNYKKKPSRTSTRTARKPEPVKEPMWNCVIPNYIKTVRRVNKAQMKTLTITYGEASCSPAS